MHGDPFLARILLGWRKPRRTTILCSDMAGQVETAGKNVTRFRPGDQVFGEVGFGGFAEYVSISQDLLVIKSADLTFAQAAAVPMAGMAALRALRTAAPAQPGQKVLINGAAGGIGTFAVQIAKSFGAEVTGVCRAGNAGLVGSIGAGQVIDYTQQDFTHAPSATTCCSTRWGTVRCQSSGGWWRQREPRSCRRGSPAWPVAWPGRAVAQGSPALTIRPPADRRPDWEGEQGRPAGLAGSSSKPAK